MRTLFTRNQSNTDWLRYVGIARPTQKAGSSGLSMSECSSVGYPPQKILETLGLPNQLNMAVDCKMEIGSQTNVCYFRLAVNDIGTSQGV